MGQMETKRLRRTVETIRKRPILQPVFEVGPNGLRPARLSEQRRKAMRAWGYHFTYDDTEQRIYCAPQGGGFGPVQIYAY